MTALDVDTLQAALVARVDGEVRFDPGTRAAYATDASNYRQIPVGVVLPRPVDAAVEAVAVCREYDAPLLSRGGGTSLAGQCCNSAVVLDWTKYCHRVVSLDVPGRTAVVEPGIVLDVLNNALQEHGLLFGPKPSTHVSCTLGGMLGNNSCGSTAQAYGKTVDNVRRLEVLLYDGTRLWVGPTDDEEYQRVVAGGGRVAQVYRQVRALRDAHLAEIRTRYPKIPRRVSGYNLDSLLPEMGFDLARALVGSEGTLVTILRAELQLVPAPRHRAMVVLGYPDIAAAADAVPLVLEHAPHVLEGLDDRLISLEREQHLNPEALQQLPEGAGWLMVQVTGDTDDEARDRARDLVAGLRHGGARTPTVAYLDDPRREDELFAVREAGLGATAHPPLSHETWEGWEDSAVPPDRLGDYLRDLRRLFDEFGYGSAALYGHFGQGCVHTRIPLELRTDAGIGAFRAFVERAADLVAGYGGSFSGEHGDGQARGELLPKMFGTSVVDAFGQLKAIFDPTDRMNPGKVVHPYRLDENLRLGRDFAPWQPRSHFGYPQDGGSFAQAAARCVGVGKCRNHGGSGVMCPSYQVTLEEEHSTRGRARLLFEMVRSTPDGDTIRDGWRSTAVRDALDLCLACKGCKSDCPVGVDMATYKAEFLAHHYAGRLRPRAHYTMGWLPLLARVAARAPRLVNLLARAPALASVLKAAGGVAGERDLPRFAAEPFTAWFARRSGTPPGEWRDGDVLLWPDTFTNFFHPQVGVAAVTVLEAAGFRVRLPPAGACCGLTWISTGQLGVARRALRRTLGVLAPALRSGARVVGLEPSCTAVLRYDAAELMPHDVDVLRLRQQTRTFAEILTEVGWTPPRVGRAAVVQTHCHQHAVLGVGPDDRLMEQAGVQADRLASGCCGLAGNFGFEHGHYAVSRAVGERVLLPAVRAADPATLVLADGFSCRTQIAQGDTGRQALHLAQVLAAALPATPKGG